MSDPDWVLVEHLFLSNPEGDPVMSWLSLRHEATGELRVTFGHALYVKDVGCVWKELVNIVDPDDGELVPSWQSIPAGWRVRAMKSQPQKGCAKPFLSSAELRLA